jgi:hypothetical protein
MKRFLNLGNHSLRLATQIGSGEETTSATPLLLCFMRRRYEFSCVVNQFAHYTLRRSGCVMPETMRKATKNEKDNVVPCFS